jgi:hypothetical protein
MRADDVFSEVLDLISPERHATYHVLAFAHDEQAAAFVAALSRLLSSPQGNVHPARAGAVQVWWHRQGSEGSLLIFLSEAALQAASSGFAPLPVAGSLSGEVLPEGSALLFDGHERIPAWGLQEAQCRLTTG